VSIKNAQRPFSFCRKVYKTEWFSNKCWGNPQKEKKTDQDWINKDPVFFAPQAG